MGESYLPQRRAPVATPIKNVVTPDPSQRSSERSRAATKERRRTSTKERNGTSTEERSRTSEPKKLRVGRGLPSQRSSSRIASDQNAVTSDLTARERRRRNQVEQPRNGRRSVRKSSLPIEPSELPIRQERRAVEVGGKSPGYEGTEEMLVRTCVDGMLATCEERQVVKAPPIQPIGAPQKCIKRKPKGQLPRGNRSINTAANEHRKRRDSCQGETKVSTQQPMNTEIERTASKEKIQRNKVTTTLAFKHCSKYNILVIKLWAWSWPGRHQEFNIPIIRIELDFLVIVILRQAKRKYPRPGMLQLKRLGIDRVHISRQRLKSIKTRSVTATETSAGESALDKAADASTGNGVRAPAAERRISERRPRRERGFVLFAVGLRLGIEDGGGRRQWRSGGEEGEIAGKPIGVVYVAT
ncbi:hypothetical protein M5K25_024741 [Dendrobium thyrsiflorum]|uniref:Uncharacterized protein n=1 Tax=Dendrobium thyrsiflorum TaxID=117978 RepID=A0ABD0U2Q9_DENTH